MDAEQPAAAPTRGDALVVRWSRWKVALWLIALAGIVASIIVSVFGYPPTSHPWPPLVGTVNGVVALIILTPLAALLIVGLLGLFSPQPICTINHEGVRTYSLFGLFGTRLIPWAHIKAMVTYQQWWDRSLKIYSDNREPIGRWAPLRRRLGPEAAVLRVSLGSTLIAGSMDTLLEQISERFGADLDAHGIRLIDQGGDPKDYSGRNWEDLERAP